MKGIKGAHCNRCISIENAPVKVEVLIPWVMTVVRKKTIFYHSFFALQEESYNAIVAGGGV